MWLRLQKIKPIVPRIFAATLFAVSLAMIAGGGWLIALNGTAYYLCCGLAVLVTAVLIWRQHPHAVTVYAVILLVTAGWAMWESGLSAWPLTARLLAPAMLGWAFLLPSMRRFALSEWARVPSLVAPVITIAVVVLLASQTVTTVNATLPAARAQATASSGADWPRVGGDAGSSRYSSLDQITPQNVNQLVVAWEHHISPGKDGKLGELEVTPLKIDNALYVCNNSSIVERLDAETGALQWRFDPEVNLTNVLSRACRGIAYVSTPQSTVCPARIISGTLDARMFALNASTGTPCSDFGKEGMVDLKVGMGEVLPGYYYPTSAPTLVRGKVVIGGWVFDNQKVDEPSGVVRAFDAVSGKLAWAWDMGRPDQHGEPGPGETYTRGTPNAWGPMSADEELGLVFVPTGNATPDYFGGQRSAAMDTYSTSLVAIDADTGSARWRFQTVHHDLWDYDVGAQPTLTSFPGPNGPIPAVIQATKTGQIYVLDRRDGKPLTEVTERQVPPSPTPGERASPTQPFSTAMPSVAGPDLDERSMWGLTPLDQLWCRIQFRRMRYDGPYTPPGPGQTSLNFPGLLGAVSWSGVAVDPTRGVVIANSNRVATTARLVPRAEVDALGVRPTGENGAPFKPGVSAQGGTPYGVLTSPFVSPLGVPCQQPPFGMLTAIDLNSLRVIWEMPLGTVSDSGPFGLRTYLPFNMGVPNFGGSLITASGLVFIGATQEQVIRAIDLRTGRIIWKSRLPAGGQATPMTYRSAVSGQQFVVIAAGGKKFLKSQPGNSIVAYALPKAP